MPGAYSIAGDRSAGFEPGPLYPSCVLYSSCVLYPSRVRELGLHCRLAGPGRPVGSNPGSPVLRAPVADWCPDRTAATEVRWEVAPRAPVVTAAVRKEAVRKYASADDS